MFKLDKDLLTKIRRNLDKLERLELQPVYVFANSKCKICDGTCERGCNSDCWSRCADGPGV